MINCFVNPKYGHCKSIQSYIKVSPNIHEGMVFLIDRETKDLHSVHDFECM
jgi:hypothetical protein